MAPRRGRRFPARAARDLWPAIWLARLAAAVRRQSAPRPPDTLAPGAAKAVVVGGQGCLLPPLAGADRPALEWVRAAHPRGRVRIDDFTPAQRQVVAAGDGP